MIVQVIQMVLPIILVLILGTQCRSRGWIRP